MKRKCTEYRTKTTILRAPKWPKMAPRSSKMAQNGPKMATRWPQKGSKIGQDSPKMSLFGHDEHVMQAMWDHVDFRIRKNAVFDRGST